MALFRDPHLGPKSRIRSFSQDSVFVIVLALHLSYSQAGKAFIFGGNN